jgi:hypothetical protein
MTSAYTTSVENLKGREKLGYIGVCGKIILIDEVVDWIHLAQDTGCYEHNRQDSPRRRPGASLTAEASTSLSSPCAFRESEGHS